MADAPAESPAGESVAYLGSSCCTACGHRDHPFRPCRRRSSLPYGPAYRPLRMARTERPRGLSPWSPAGPIPGPQEGRRSGRSKNPFSWLDDYKRFSVVGRNIVSKRVTSRFQSERMPRYYYDARAVVARHPRVVQAEGAKFGRGFEIQSKIENIVRWWGVVWGCGLCGKFSVCHNLGVRVGPGSPR